MFKELSVGSVQDARNDKTKPRVGLTLSDLKKCELRPKGIPSFILSLISLGVEFRGKPFLPAKRVFGLPLACTRSKRASYLVGTRIQRSRRRPNMSERI
jgi:hypothetical protein